MSTINQTIGEVLNDLIRINNDRIEGYRKASEEIYDEELRSLFRTMMDESRKIISELSLAILATGESPDSGETTTAGKIYRAWMGVKVGLSGHQRESAIVSCIFGEEAAQTAYRDALAHPELTPQDRQLILNQQVALKESLLLMKAFDRIEKNESIL